MRSLRTRPTWRAVAGLILSVTPAIVLKRALQARNADGAVRILTGLD
jgi:hypothetical protein